MGHLPTEREYSYGKDVKSTYMEKGVQLYFFQINHNLRCIAIKIITLSVGWEIQIIFAPYNIRHECVWHDAMGKHTSKTWEKRPSAASRWAFAWQIALMVDASCIC